MITVGTDELFVSWLQSRIATAGFASERPADLETRGLFCVVRRGGGGDIEQYLDGPVVYIDCYGPGWSTASDLARQVDYEFRENTPAAWMGQQFSFLRCNQGAIKIPDPNTGAVRHLASIYSFSLQ